MQLRPLTETSAPWFRRRILHYDRSKTGGPRSQDLLRASSWVLAVCAALALVAVIAAEEHNDRDVILHAEATALLFVILLISLAARWALGREAHGRAGMSDHTEQPLAQLVKEKDAAVAASAAKSRYLASISHEIRSPLNSIYGYAQLVERGDGVTATEAARVIARSAEHLTNLVEGLLDISQIEHGVLRVNADIVRFPAFLDQIVSMFHHSAVTKGLCFRYEPPARLPEFVRVDEKRLRQVLINLLSNAIKYTQRGEVCFRVGYAGQMARFEVIDTGPGIAPEDQQRIFHPFERVPDSGSAPSQVGVGLGLPITRAIVQILGGDLELESEPGAGSTFRVTMLLGRVAGQMQETAPMQRITGYEGGRRTVLVVDDDVSQLALSRRLLETLGFDVLAATGGESALALCEQQAPDLALLDITMPGMSGWETASALRGRYGGSLRILMLSANAGERAGQGQGTAPLHDLFLVKPVEIGALLDAIGRALELRWIRDAADVASPGRTAAPARAAIPDAALPHIRQIREMLRIGHVRAIEAEIKMLAKAAPEADALVQRLFSCLDCFDLTALAAQLDEVDDDEFA
ncbi:ATP-binding protein [Sphingobium sp. DEHP117]|uniref:ATP-binding response regulator n=1 Tax=Sphingobium sp. DEHP117 TaxID=2993436 RepID=UPI0027D6DF7C|nr:ATP-binding protein [Sphingobium sp. DEHP117]MDQ4420958.1 ATP-binding protein [Sphingobium sp. DEHP117]